jgi:hypothetical protein
VSEGVTSAGISDVSLPADAVTSHGSQFSDVRCWAVGTCFAAGYYYTTANTVNALTAPISGGEPGPASAVALPAGAATPSSSQLNALSCWSAGSCVAVGDYQSSGSGQQGLIVPINGSSAGAGIGVALPSSGGAVNLYDAACSSDGSCVAVGSYVHAGSGEALIVPIANGTPQTALSPSLPTALSSGTQNAYLNSVSCGTAGSCVAVGFYRDDNGSQAFEVPIHDGVMGSPVEVTAPNAGSAPTLNSVSCSAAATCYAVGSYTDAANNEQAMVVPIGAVGVGSAVEVPDPANGVGDATALSGVSCLPAGSCLAVGSYDAGSENESMTVAIAGGTIGPAVMAPNPPDEASSAADPQLSNVACDAASGSCVAVGQYTTSVGYGVPYVVTLQTPLSLTTTSLPWGTVGAAYNQTLAATGAWGSYSWSVTSGSLPPGLNLNAQTGVIAGTPTSAGTATFTVQATGTGNPIQTAPQQLTVTITKATTPSPVATTPSPEVAISGGGLLRVSGSRVGVNLLCSAAPCTGTVKLVATLPVTVRHGRKRVHRHRTAVIGSAGFSLAAGDRGTVTVALNATGRRLLASSKRHRLPVRVVAAVAGGNQVSRAATLWTKVAKHHGKP